jgi:hypothetical protein
MARLCYQTDFLPWHCCWSSMATTERGLRSCMWGTQLTCCCQIDVGHGRKAIVIFVPVPLLPNWHKIQQRYDSQPLCCASSC